MLSAGCHAGYNIDGLDAVPGVTTLAWPQAFTEAGATLIAGTGYQYGDTNYVAYSDQIYVLLAQQLGYEPDHGAGPVAIGSALLGAKLQYLAGLDQLNGSRRRPCRKITLYGLPMLGIQEPNRAAVPSVSPPRRQGVDGADPAVPTSQPRYDPRAPSSQYQREPDADREAGSGSEELLHLRRRPGRRLPTRGARCSRSKSRRQPGRRDLARCGLLERHLYRHPGPPR